MLKRIYVDNYKCLVNTELEVNEINLFLGANGSGKSTVFEILRAIQNFVCDGERTTRVFDASSLTRWQTSLFQTFELELEGNQGMYKYELLIKYHGREPLARAQHERLFFNGNPLVRLEEDGEVQLYRDDHSEGPHFPVDWTLSAVGAIPERHDNSRLTWFREQFKRFIIAQIMPPMMSTESIQGESRLSRYLENYASWYRYISQDQGMIVQLMSELKEVIPCFDSFKFTGVGEQHRLLNVCFRDKDTQALTSYKFSELSDGQRMLIALYTLLYVSQTDRDYKYTLCLDEPENFVALPEIQPWLIKLHDSCMDEEVQALLISHHPEFINYLLASPVGYWFERQDNHLTRVKPIVVDEPGGLPISEIVARGWLNE